MDETEVKLAIDKGKLPITTGDKIALCIWMIFSVIMLYICYDLSANYQEHVFAFFYLLALIFCLYCFWQVFEKKKLIVYQCPITIEKKETLLDKLLGGQDIHSFERDDYFVMYREWKGWFSYTYRINILYSESAFYINAIKDGGRLSWFSKEKVNKTINRIKELEAEM